MQYFRKAEGARISNMTFSPRRQRLKKTQHVLYFRKAGALRISNMLRELSENPPFGKNSQIISQFDCYKNHQIKITIKWTLTLRECYYRREGC